MRFRSITPSTHPTGSIGQSMVRPCGAVTNNRTIPETTSSRTAAPSPSRWITTEAGIFRLTAPTIRSSLTSAGRSRKCDAKIADSNLRPQSDWPRLS
jgi:hypothetical protein